MAANSKMNNTIIALPKMRDDCVLFSSDDDRSADDVYDIYLCVRNRTALLSAFKALAHLSNQILCMNYHVINRLVINVPDIISADPCCTDEFLSAALNSYCSEISSTPAAFTVHFMMSIVAPTLFTHVDKSPRDFGRRARILEGDDNPDLNEPVPDNLTTIFNSQSRVRAFVLPLHDEGHWSLLVWYRFHARSKSWFSIHYDTVSPMHFRAASRFTHRFAQKVCELEPEFSLVSAETGEILFSAEGRLCKRALCTPYAHTPQQTNGWVCGYRVIMMALAVAFCNGDPYETGRLIMSDRYTSNDACAKYISRTLEKLASYATQISMRNRCRNLFDFRGVTEDKTCENDKK